MKIEIRKAITSDSKLLSDLGRKTFYDTWRPVNTEEDMQKYLAKAFDLKIIEADVKASEINTFLISYYEGVANGYVKLRRDRTYDEFKNEKVIEVERIYVLKEWQNKKIGTALMDEALKIANEEKHSWIWLGVNIDNVKAINFYKHFDFTIFGEKSFKLGEAVDTDYLMKKKLIDSLIG